MRLIVMASGSGSNFEAIVKAIQTNNYDVVALIVDQPDAYVITRAKKLNIPCHVIELKNTN